MPTVDWDLKNGILFFRGGRWNEGARGGVFKKIVVYKNISVYFKRHYGWVTKQVMVI